MDTIYVHKLLIR